MNDRIHSYIEEQRNAFELLEESAHSRCAQFIQSVRQMAVTHVTIDSETPELIHENSGKILNHLNLIRDVFNLDEDNTRLDSKLPEMNVDCKEIKTPDLESEISIVATSLPMTIMRPRLNDMLPTEENSNDLNAKAFEAPHLFVARTYVGDVFNQMRSQSVANRQKKTE